MFLLAVFQRLGSSDPVDLDYGWNGNTWICDELGLRFDLPAGGVIYDSEEQQKAREEKFGRRGSAGQVLLTVILLQQIKIGKRRVAEEAGHERRMMLQFAHE